MTLCQTNCCRLLTIRHFHCNCVGLLTFCQIKCQVSIRQLIPSAGRTGRANRSAGNCRNDCTTKNTQCGLLCLCKALLYSRLRRVAQSLSVCTGLLGPYYLLSPLERGLRDSLCTRGHPSTIMISDSESKGPNAWTNPLSHRTSTWITRRSVPVPTMIWR
ncbi:MAG: hypothetical protein JWM11_950 [Planctomycetaceae bacterium]|nr:hypothetical protein [Planctomycetaceae bacterium]